MGNIILACQTIKNEVNLAIEETGVDYPVLFVESGLHNFPDRLGKRIQEEIDKIENVDNILLAFGYCGNSLLGIKSSMARLIIPKADDCISLLLGSYELRQNLSKEVGTYFLTKGWLENEQNLLTEYDRCVKRHGREKALRIMKLMLKHYHRLMIIDTHAFQLEDIFIKTKSFADLLGLSHEKIDGSMRFLKKLLLGPWDEEFVIIELGEEFTMEHMGIKNVKDVSGNQLLFGINS